MKGFIVNINDKNIVAAMENGIADVLITNKEGPYRLLLGGMDDKTISYSWYSVDLELDDSFTVTYDEVECVSIPKRIWDAKNNPEDDLAILESYHKLKQELIEEGLITI